jgi:hypothetical protein
MYVCERQYRQILGHPRNPWSSPCKSKPTDSGLDFILSDYLCWFSVQCFLFFLSYFLRLASLALDSLSWQIMFSSSVYVSCGFWFVVIVMCEVLSLSSLFCILRPWVLGKGLTSNDFVCPDVYLLSVSVIFKPILKPPGGSLFISAWVTDWWIGCPSCLDLDGLLQDFSIARSQISLSLLFLS